MVRLNRIYTRTGDDGTTGLVDGSRLPKDDPRIAAYGTVDEASAALGVARLHAAAPYDMVLRYIQNDLFDLGADLATPGGVAPDGALRVVEAQVQWLEQEIDRLNADLAPLTSFILPGGTMLSAQLHVARTVVRRAERDAVTASGRGTINPVAIRYLNRLSDLMFVMARHAARAEDGGPGDILWVPAANRRPAGPE
jgi:cob(I)alamin adenosyltransferase